MLRVTLRKVRTAEDFVQSSLSKSGEIFRVDAVLELSPSASARLSRNVRFARGDGRLMRPEKKASLKTHPTLARRAQSFVF